MLENHQISYYQSNSSISTSSSDNRPFFHIYYTRFLTKLNLLIPPMYTIYLPDKSRFADIETQSRNQEQTYEDNKTREIVSNSQDGKKPLFLITFYSWIFIRWEIFFFPKKTESKNFLIEGHSRFLWLKEKM